MYVGRVSYSIHNKMATMARKTIEAAHNNLTIQFFILGMPRMLSILLIAYTTVNCSLGVRVNRPRQDLAGQVGSV